MNENEDILLFIQSMKDVCLGHSFLHIANTFYEEELESFTKRNLENWMTANPMYLLLQFLPVLYAHEADSILISALADEEYLKRIGPLGFPTPQFVTFRENAASFNHIESWGPSRAIENWAASHNIKYAIPGWEMVKRINSKEFSFRQGVALPHAQLLFCETDFDKWFHSFEGPKVLKTCFGVSGRGHHFISNKESAMAFLGKQWALAHPVIGEPWVERLMDFSSQWTICKNKRIGYSGSTVCLNDPRGGFVGNIVGDDLEIFGDYIKGVEIHREYVQETLNTLADMGYFGNIGFDAMFYLWKGETMLQPIVEINARKTMGWVALKIQERLCPGRKGRLELAKGSHPQNLLPNVLALEKQNIQSKRSLLFYA